MAYKTAPGFNGCLLSTHNFFFFFFRMITDRRTDKKTRKKEEKTVKKLDNGDATAASLEQYYSRPGYITKLNDAREAQDRH